MVNEDRRAQWKYKRLQNKYILQGMQDLVDYLGQGNVVWSNQSLTIRKIYKEVAAAEDCQEDSDNNGMISWRYQGSV